MDDDLLDEDQDFDFLVNVLSIFPREYDMWSMSEEEDLEESLPVLDIKPVCYYVMDNGCVELQQAIFEKPDESINKVLIDGGVAVNLMPLSLLSKSGHSWGVIQVDVAIESSVRPTLFLVVPSKAN
ncbi:hypothetical protein L195_g045949 [Trifolium pratense]|uniref:Uncharacterized protein n=1 Tax=Trifolium pratense TaxID=57577 RepID=A0A2K3MGB1_TRIPR|nr:hypothetical protein L195_g045949 [Trifolium pratense]